MRRAAARSRCANNLKQIALAAHNYRDTHGYFPAGTVPHPGLPPDQRLGYNAVLLPYLEQKAVSDKLDPAAAWDAPANAAAVKGPTWAVFQCPDWRRERWQPGTGSTVTELGHTAFTNYVGVAGVGPDAALLREDDPRAGMFGYDRKLKAEQVKDGTANTALLLETGRDVGPWLRGGPATVRGLDPADMPVLGDGRPFGGTHFLDSTVLKREKPHGSHVVFADGSVRYVPDTANPAVLLAAATIAGGEPVPTDW